MEPHQQALVDQAIRHALTRYDDRSCLLRSSEDPRFRVVQESLAFAALLLLRAGSRKSHKSELGLARLLIDTIVPLQNTTRRDPGRGAFPMVWTPDSSRPVIMDPDSREIMGSLLGLLVKDHGALLGEKRAAKVRAAVRLSMRDESQGPPGTTSGAMIAAWLEMEFGDRWRGERLATDVALAGYDHLVEKRFGDARAFARELWALSLWRRSSRLHDGVESLTESLLEDILSYAHPCLPEVFGAVTTSRSSPNNTYPWLGTWLTWHALGDQPMLPKNMLDPLHSTLFAFPAVARLKLSRPESNQAEKERELKRQSEIGTITGWWEKDLHIEARASEQPEGNRMPVAGARWQTPGGESVWMRCRVSKQESAVCRKRFIHLDDPGTTIVNVFNMGEGETRMIDNGWWLSGLHFATEGLQMVDAQRSSKGLELHFKPTADQAMLMFSPLK
jgi:hypothetical protein